MIISHIVTTFLRLTRVCIELKRATYYAHTRVIPFIIMGIFVFDFHTKKNNRSNTVAVE